MFDDTLTLCTSSSFSGAAADRVIGVRVMADCTIVAGCCRGRRRMVKNHGGVVTTTKTQRPIVIVATRRWFRATHDETGHEEIQREADRDRGDALGSLISAAAHSPNARMMTDHSVNTSTPVSKRSRTG